MNKLSMILAAVLLLAVTACNNNSGGEKATATDNLKAKADSLYKDVLHGHDEGMAGFMKIEGKQNAIRHLLDSLNKLPGKDETTARLKEMLTQTSAGLQSAYEAMDKWMESMNLDSAENNLEARISYLTQEKTKAGEIATAIKTSLAKADSLLTK